MCIVSELAHLYTSPSLVSCASSQLIRIIRVLFELLSFPFLFFLPIPHTGGLSDFPLKIRGFVFDKSLSSLPVFLPVLRALCSLC